MVSLEIGCFVRMDYRVGIVEIGILVGNYYGGLKERYCVFDKGRIIRNEKIWWN